MFDCLGKTPEEIHQTLKALRIGGARNTVRILNPIVRFGYSKLPGMLNLNVMTGHSMRMTYPNGQQKELPLPQAVVEFLVAFNKGDYPDLEALSAVQSN